MAEPRLVHFGSAVIDFIYRLDRLPRAGEDLIASSYLSMPGGGFNMMAAAKRSGLATAFAGRIGDGPAGAILHKAFRDEDIDVLTPLYPGEDTGVCIVMVTDDAERTFVSYPGAESRLSADDLLALELAPTDWLFTSGYTLLYPQSGGEQVRFLKEVNPSLTFVFDPTGIVADIPADRLEAALSRADWLSCNRDEAMVMIGADREPADLALALLDQRCPRATGVVLRLGASGAVLALRGETPRTIPAFEVDAIDTTGAGDCHLGAFVAALSRGDAPERAVEYANAAAALSTLKHGGATAPDREDVDLFLNRARKLDQ
jgi:sugar/nucleoside kinase (ribokinase family)